MTDRGRQILGKVVRRIGEVAPPGLGRWPEAWATIADPSDTFLDALATWEASDTSETRYTLRAAATEFVQAWRRAAEAWESDGRPGATENVLEHSDA